MPHELILRPQRYIQIVERDGRGRLPALKCPYDHKLRKQVKCWGEWGFRCDGRRNGHGRIPYPCNAWCWIISLPDEVYIVAEVTESEMSIMERERMERWQQLAFLTRQIRSVAA